MRLFSRHCFAFLWVVLLGFGMFPVSSGAAGNSSEALQAQSAQLFESKVAPLLARYCFECHDTSANKGKLDLSRRESALAERKNGRTIVPHQSSESLLWKSVESNEMPEDRPPLSDEEKNILRQWIDSGAVWTADSISPVAHTRDSRAANNWIQRLTVPEYVETVKSAVGVDIEAEAQRLLPPDVRADGFYNTAYNLSPDLRHVEAYSALAALIVQRMDVPKFAARFTSCQDLNDECVRKFIANAGKWMLRAPLKEPEIDAFLAVSKAVEKEGGKFDEALKYILEAMLQSPRFIYRMENQHGDGKPRKVAPYELASRLSYIVWGAPPDEALRKAADTDQLSNKAQVRAQVERMLKDSRAIKRSSRFIYEWLDLARLSSLRPDRQHFSTWIDALANDMRDETIAFFEEVAWKQKRPLGDLLNAKVTFVTPRLAQFYGLLPHAEKPDFETPSEHGREGLQALYTFDEGEGDVVRDLSAAGTPIHLKIKDPKAVQWGSGSLAVNSNAVLGSERAVSKRLVDAVKKSKAISIEVWLTPADLKQSGPARIVSLSSGPSQRNFSLAQDADKFDVRFRSVSTDGNGLPSLPSPAGSLEKKLTHVVYIHNATGKETLFINGANKASKDGGGDLSNWDSQFQLVLANETTGDRPWRGTLHSVAIYSRALSTEEVIEHHNAGRAKEQSPAIAAGLTRYDLSSVPSRGGILTQGAALTVGGEEASMVARGLFILYDFLYSAVGNPPPCADTTPVPPKPGLTNRQIAQTRIDNKSCGGCHSKFEPLAFGLEKFNGLGAFHEVDEFGNKLREDGEILFPGEDKAVKYNTTGELMDLLAKNPRVQKNITRKVTQFAIGRPLLESDAEVIDEIHNELQKNGGTYASLITAVACSDLVRMTPTEKADTKETK